MSAFGAYNGRYFIPGAFGLISPLTGPRITGSISTCPSVSRSISIVIAPVLKVSEPHSTSTIVDSTPIPTAPPSITISIFPSISSMTCSALCRARSSGCSTRRRDRNSRQMDQAVCPPGQTACGPQRCQDHRSFRKGTMSFRKDHGQPGPASIFSASFRPASGISFTIAGSSSIQEIWAISGLSDGRPFAA